MKKAHGFTLIELLVVIAIILILSAVAITAFSSARSKTKDNARMAAVREVQKALQVYWTQNGSYPAANTPIDLTTLPIVPTYINSIDYNMANLAIGAVYYRPTNNADSYMIYVSLEQQTQVSPSAYGCRTGIGPVVDTSIYYSFAPKC